MDDDRIRQRREIIIVSYSEGERGSSAIASGSIVEFIGGGWTLSFDGIGTAYGESLPDVDQAAAILLDAIAFSR